MRWQLTGERERRRVASMAEETARWRGSVCLLLLFFIAVFLIEGRALVIFTRSFLGVRTAWLPAQGLVQESLIATSGRRGSGMRSAAVVHTMLFTDGVRVRYAFHDKPH